MDSDVKITSSKESINIDNTTILLTGAIGFIGYHLALKLLTVFNNSTIIGIDSFTEYYDTTLKEYRLTQIEFASKQSSCSWKLLRTTITNKDAINKLFDEYHFSIVINLAAQAGVKHLIYASSSSVYGGNKKIPFSTNDSVDHPVSLYAATKKSDELLAHSYSKLYNIPSTGLRFFTIYGPAGRPDMAYYSFSDKLRNGEKINLFNYGNCNRDFTYVDDIIEGIIRVIKGAPAKKTGDDGLPIAPYSIYNIGGGQPGDVPVTYADSTDLERDYGFKPQHSVSISLISIRFPLRPQSIYMFKQTIFYFRPHRIQNKIYSLSTR